MSFDTQDPDQEQDESAADVQQSPEEESGEDNNPQSRKRKGPDFSFLGDKTPPQGKFPGVKTPGKGNVKGSDIAGKGAKTAGQGAKTAASDKLQKGVETAGKLPKNFAKQLGTGLDVAEAAKNKDIVGVGKALSKEAAKELVKKGSVSLLGNPYFWAVIGIIIAVIIQILIIIIAAGIVTCAHKVMGNDPIKSLDLLTKSIFQSVRCTDINQFASASDAPTITKTGPVQVPNPAGNGPAMKYTITVGYPGAAQDVTLTDTIPANATFATASGKIKQEKSGNKITKIIWSLSENGANKNGTFNFTTDITLQPDKPDSFVINLATATVVGPGSTTGGGPATGKYVAPSADNCGKYNLNNPTRKNFGDPACNFDKNKLYDMLKQQDPGNASFWFLKVVRCESGYNPNAYAPPSTGTPDPKGAFGLYQMNSSTPPGGPDGAPSTGPRGDVNWDLQTANAINKGKSLGGNLAAYWACAR